MKVYIATLHDQHISDSLVVFAKEDAAIERCKSWLREEQRYHRFDIEVKERLYDGYAYFAEYCGEGNSAFVKCLTVVE